MGFTIELKSCTARADNVMKRGVPLPERWAAALQATALPAVAKESAERMHARDPALLPQCQVLGVPKKTPIPHVSTERMPGAIVVVRRPDGRRHRHILCAHVDGTRWWSHRGYADNQQEVFDCAGLELIDVELDAWSEEAASGRKRLRGRCDPADPRALALEFPTAFAAVVAVGR